MTGLAAQRDWVQAGDLLDLWKRVAPLASMERALALAAGNLGAGDSNGADTPALRRQPVGHIYARLLELRERLWGPSLQAVATCPGCASRVEFVLMTTGLPRTSMTRPLSGSSGIRRSPSGLGGERGPDGGCGRTATATTRPCIDGEWLKPGTMVGRASM